MSGFLLENDHNVYILGAGFSAGAGLPIVRDFMSRMRDAATWLKEQGRIQELESVEAVLEFRLRAASAAYRTCVDLENVEELFSLASAAGELSLAAHMQRAIAATIDYCTAASRTIDARTRTVVLLNESPLRQTLDPKLWPAEHGKESGYADGVQALAVTDFMALLGALIGDLSAPSAARRNTLISFNYDLLVERCLARLGHRISYGIRPDRFAAAAPWMGDGVPLLKLHGSMNWAFGGAPSQGMTGHGDYSDVLSTKAAPVLVPPTWRKEFVNQLTDVWDAAVQALQTATRIVVIGFSMPVTDQHFRYLVSAGLRDNISLRSVVFIDPAAHESVKERGLQILRPELAERGSVAFVAARALDILEPKLMHTIGRPLAPATEIFLPI